MKRPKFIREKANPILSAADWPYPINSVFNPGATRLQDGRVLLLCRCEDFRGHSHLTKAISENGVDGWQIDSKPTLEAEPTTRPEELWGIEDPRITYMEDEDTFVCTYTAYSRKGPGVSLVTTKDFESFEKKGLVLRPSDKDAALFPRKFDGRYCMIHRPSRDESGDMWLSFGSDLNHWGESELWMRSRQGAWWDARKIGLCGPPIETPSGWLVFYHGVRTHASGSIYRVGAALFDLVNPRQPIARGDEWLMGPEEPYEFFGDVGWVVFPCGNVIESDGDTITLYYGAADMSIGIARVSMNEVVEFLTESEESYVHELSLRYIEDANA